METKNLAATIWSKAQGTREELRKAAFDLITSGNLQEIRIEREMLDVFEGPYLVETVPSGQIRIELVLTEREKEEKG